ncbi:2466_t:CDS:2, partial [Racocetra fulgida]
MCDKDESSLHNCSNNSSPLSSYISNFSSSPSSLSLSSALINLSSSSPIKDISLWSSKEFLILASTLEKFIPFIRFLQISSSDFYKKVKPFASILPCDLYDDILQYHLVPDYVPHDDLSQPERAAIDSVIIERKHAALIASWIDDDLKMAGNFKLDSRCCCKQGDYEFPIRENTGYFSVDEYEVFSVHLRRPLGKDVKNENRSMGDPTIDGENKILGNNNGIEYYGHDKNTTRRFMYLFRNIVTASLVKDDEKIGGEGTIVEIDESKFRSGEKLIKTHVKPGSTIYTDSWKGYSELENMGMRFKHRRVNHKKPSKNQIIKRIHTQHIEGVWSGIKQNMLKRNMVKEKIENHLKEFSWRRKHENNLWN